MKPAATPFDPAFAPFHEESDMKKSLAIPAALGAMLLGMGSAWAQTAPAAAELACALLLATGRFPVNPAPFQPDRFF